jgi:hypothetical protein
MKLGNRKVSVARTKAIDDGFNGLEFFGGVGL